MSLWQSLKNLFNRDRSDEDEMSLQSLDQKHARAFDPETGAFIGRKIDLGDGKTILIDEDDPVMAEAIARAMRGNGVVMDISDRGGVSARELPPARQRRPGKDGPA